MAEIRAVFFDLDGTLIDSESQASEAVRQVCEEKGLKLPTFLLEKTYGKTWGAAFAEVASLHPEFARAFSGPEPFVARYREILRSEGVRAIPGAVEFVQTVADAGLDLCVVSGSGRAEITHALKGLGILEIFGGPSSTRIFGAEDYARSKPAPDGFLKALAHVSLPPTETVVFEDSLPGVLSARAAGIRVVHVQAVAWTKEEAQKHAQARIQDYRDWLPEFEARIRAGERLGRTLAELLANWPPRVGHN